MQRTSCTHAASRNPKTSTRRRSFRPWFELLETRCLLDASGLRSITGFGNNIANPTFGQAGIDLIRNSPVAYVDGVNAPSQPNTFSPRALSNALNDQTDPNNPSQDLSTPQAQHLSDFAYVWGQFIDHDMDLTLDNSGQAFPIPVPAGDPIGPNPLPFTRSNFDPNTGTSTSNPRQQINSITSFLDLSQVYGSDAATADALRSHVGGQLKTSTGNLLPYDNATFFTPQQLAALNQAEGGMANPGQLPTSNIFAAGDVRANENIELTALQTLFMRNHNRLAAQLQKEHPDWSDERLYQEARKLNIAEEQIITYTEFLPAILGPNALPAYQGYDPNVNPSIATEFSTVAFRFGHSLLSGTVGRNTNNGLDIPDVTGSAGVDLSQDFFDPNLINPNGLTDPITGHTSSDIGAILKADADNTANEMDLLAIRQVRNLLLADGNVVNQDLIARDIQRARDHGIGTYNQVRVAYGLPPVTSFADITSDVSVQQKLQATYGTVDKIDPFEGMLAEDHLPGADVGPTIKAILVDQFRRLRDGDRFFYLNEHFSHDELKLIHQGDTLAKVIKDNTNITNLQSDVFHLRISISGTVFADFDNDCGRQTQGETGVQGITVNLLDDTGATVTTTTTDENGRYSFTDFTGLPGTGNFSVSIVVPAGSHQTTAAPGTLLISRGDIHKVANFGIAANSSTSAGDGSGAQTNVFDSGGRTGTVSANPDASSAVLSNGDTAAPSSFSGGLPSPTNDGSAPVVNVAMLQTSAPVVQSPGAGFARSAPPALATQDTSVGLARSRKASLSSSGSLGVDWEQQHLARILAPDALFPIGL